MLQKISKSMAHFFVVQNVSKPEYEAVYAYGAEILLSMRNMDIYESPSARKSTLHLDTFQTD